MWTRMMLRKCSFFSSFTKNHYQTLGIDKSASQQQIKSAYYKLAKVYHPDISSNNAQKFRQITEAYNILKDPIKKKQLDRTLESPKTKFQDMNMNEYFNGSHRNFKQGARYQYPINPDRYGRNFNKDFIRKRMYMNNQMRNKFSLNPGIPFSHMRLIALSFFVFFGFIVALQILLNFYKLAQMQRQQFQISYIPYDIEEQQDDY